MLLSQMTRDFINLRLKAATLPQVIILFPSQLLLSHICLLMQTLKHVWTRYLRWASSRSLQILTDCLTDFVNLRCECAFGFFFLLLIDIFFISSALHRLLWGGVILSYVLPVQEDAFWPQIGLWIRSKVLILLVLPYSIIVSGGGPLMLWPRSGEEVESVSYWSIVFVFLDFRTLPRLRLSLWS